MMLNKKIKEYGKQYRANNKEYDKQYHKQYGKQYRLMNKEKIKQWYIDNSLFSRGDVK